MSSAATRHKAITVTLISFFVHTNSANTILWAGRDIHVFASPEPSIARDDSNTTPVSTIAPFYLNPRQIGLLLGYASTPEKQITPCVRLNFALRAVKPPRQ